MPTILPLPKTDSVVVLKQDKIDYTYPFGLDFTPGSELHTHILGECLYRLHESANIMSRRHDSWREMDRLMTSYIRLDDAEEAIKQADSRRPVPTVVPLSYATMETLLTYLVAVYMDEPIFRYEEVGSEDTMGAALLELIISMQTRRFKAPLALHTMFRDNLIYGIGAAAPIWKQKWGFKTRDGFREDKLLFEGNDIINIDPYKYLPDVSVASHKLQDGSYVGWYYTTNYGNLLNREYEDDTMFNVKYLNKLQTGYSTLIPSDYSERDRDKVTNMNSRPSSVRNFDVAVFEVDLVPAEWKLGSDETIEKWTFWIAGDAVIIKAFPSEMDHNMFGVTTCSTNFDGYSASPMATLEITAGLQTAVDFLYNSHITNVRKSLNDMFIVDPEMVNMNDLMNPEAGMLVRLRKKAWGRGVKDAVQQFQVNDVTRQNIGDIDVIHGMVARASGATNAVDGQIITRGERKSATEIRSTRGSALSRLEKQARVAGLQCVQDLAYMFASQTQQFMSAGTYVKIAGEHEQELRAMYGTRGAVAVNPADIDIDYDIIPYDGSLPTSGDPELWVQLLQSAAGNPELAAIMDTTKIFKHFARLAGAKNVQSFVKQGGGIAPTVTPDAEVLREVDKGNMIPTGDVG